MDSTFQPRQLTHEQTVELDEAKNKLNRLEAELEVWKRKVREAPLGSPEMENARKERAYCVLERDNAQRQFKELKKEFGQVLVHENNAKSKSIKYRAVQGTPQESLLTVHDVREI